MTTWADMVYLGGWIGGKVDRMEAWVKGRAAKQTKECMTGLWTDGRSNTPRLMNSTRQCDTPQIFVSDFINGRDDTVWLWTLVYNGSHTAGRRIRNYLPNLTDNRLSHPQCTSEHSVSSG